MSLGHPQQQAVKFVKLKMRQIKSRLHDGEVKENNLIASLLDSSSSFGLQHHLTVSVFRKKTQ